ncbi:Uncharacterised protein [Vibrio cholerae]|nr:Uncharacterised protein [Vibrio cholerae]
MIHITSSGLRIVRNPHLVHIARSRKTFAIQHR